MKNYFVYLPESPAAAIWGCSATSTGYARIAAGAPYPPTRHPSDHHFTWARGRILQAYQIILITEGSGTFESARTSGKVIIEAGSVFLVFPGVWHRYAPDEQNGWVEHWIECSGPAFDRAVEQRLIHPEKPVHSGSLNAEMATAFASIHAWAREDAFTHQNLLSTLGLHLLALLAQSDTRAHADSAALLIQRAKLLILERFDEALNMEQVARDLKVGYSHFRQLFKEHTGVSPKQYHVNVRLARARDFLSNTDKPLKEIAALLGFHSAFHFSTQFKGAMGSAPSEWRTRQD